MSHVPVIGNCDEGQDPGFRHVLAVHELRRNMARVTDADRSTECVSMAVTPASAVRELLELIAALDRRVPQVQRAGGARSPVTRLR